MERTYYSTYTIRRYGGRFPERPNPRPLAPSLRVLPLHAYGIGCSPLALKSIISSFLHRLHPLPMHSGSLLRKPLRIFIFSAFFSEFFKPKFDTFSHQNPRSKLANFLVPVCGFSRLRVRGSCGVSVCSLCGCVDSEFLWILE